MDEAYGTRTVLNSSRLEEDPKYAMSPVDLPHNSMNANYMMNGAVLTNGYSPSDYVINRESYPPDMMPQFNIDQGANPYNNTMPMNSIIHTDPNDSISMQGMKTGLDTTTGFDSYTNLMNYNNTQNTIQANQVPLNFNDYHSGEDMMYMNYPSTGDHFSPDYLNTFPAKETDPMTYANNFSIPNGNFNTMLSENNNYNYNSMPYSMPIFENMNNPQMYMQQMNPKQAVLPGPTPKMDHTCSIRKMPAVSKRKIKAKKFFPCC